MAHVEERMLLRIFSGDDTPIQALPDKTLANIQWWLVVVSDGRWLIMVGG